MIPLEVRRASKTFEDNNPQASLHEAFIQGYMFANGEEAIPTSLAIADNSVSDDELFAYAWNLYDRKDNRKSALKAWKKLSNADKEKVIRCIPAYVKAHDEKKYRPMFATFLNQERYNDEEYVTDSATTNRENRGEESDREFISSSLHSILQSHSD